MPPKKWKIDMDLTRFLYETSEQQRLNQQINEIHQRHKENKVKADLGGDDEPAELGNAAFPPLNGVVGKDQNSSDAIPVPAPGTETAQEVVKRESSSASENSESSSNPPCAENPDEQKITSSSSNAEEPSEDPASTNVAAAVVKSDLDVGQVSSTTESASTSTTMSMTGQQAHSKHNLWNRNPDNSSEQQFTSTSSNSDEPSSSIAAAAVNSEPASASTTKTITIIELFSKYTWTLHPFFVPNFDEFFEVKENLVAIIEETWKWSPASDSSFQQSEYLQRGNLSSSPIEGRDGSLAPESSLCSGQPSQAHLDSNPGSSTPYGNQGQPSQAHLGSNLGSSTRYGNQGQPSQAQLGSNPGSSTPYGNQGQPSQVQIGYNPGSSNQGQPSQAQLGSNPGSSTPYGNQGQPSQAPPSYAGHGNLGHDPSQTLFLDESQHQGDSQSSQAPHKVSRSKKS